MKGRQKRRPTEVDRLNNLWVGRQGFSLLRRRPLRRFRALRAALANAHAFTQLRAPTGSNPCTGNKKDGQPKLTVSTIFGWAVRGSACSAGGRCGAFAPCALRWQTLIRFLSSAPFRVRTRAAVTKKRPASASRFSILWWAVRGSNPGPWD